MHKLESQASVDVKGLQYLHNYFQSEKPNKWRQLIGRMNDRSHCRTSQNKHEIENKVGEFDNAVGIMKKVRKDYLVKKFLYKLKNQIVLNGSPSLEQNSLSFQNQTTAQNTQKSLHQANQHLYLSGAYIILQLCILVAMFLLLTIADSFTIDPVLKLVFNIVQLCYIAKVTIDNILITYNCFQYRSTFRTWFRQVNLWDLLLLGSMIFHLYGHKEFSFIIICFLLKNMSDLSEQLDQFYYELSFSAKIDRYWRLIKIVLFNFLIAHSISIILNLLPSNENTVNWYSIKNIESSSWVEQYVWGFYWGVNIMLTVGFGDLSATNVTQALVLIFIQTFACAIFAYNISQISKILQNTEQMSEKRNYRFKVFQKIAKRYELSKEFLKKIKNFISDQIKQQYEYSFREEERVMSELPSNVQLDIKRTINQNIFEGFPFFRLFSKKLHLTLAEKIHKIIAHPQQIVMKKGQCEQVMILRVGHLDLTYIRGASVMNGSVIESFKVRQGGKPQLLSLGFLQMQTLTGNLKSCSYSIINCLERLEFESILKQTSSDSFEFYCQQRDQSPDGLLNSGMRTCHWCHDYRHNKAVCPKFHFCPSKEHCIQKYLAKDICRQTPRKRFLRSKKQMARGSCLKHLDHNRGMLKENHDTYETFSKLKTLFSVNSITSRLFQFDNPNTSLINKIDKCQSSIDEALIILKNETHNSQLITDQANNYSKYFPRFNSNKISKKRQPRLLPF